MRALAPILLGASLAAGPARAADAAGCTLPSPDGWTAHHTAHFDVYLSGRSRTKIGLLAVRLERTRALVLKALMGEDVEIPGRVLVLAFDSAGDFRHATGATQASALFVVPGETGRPTIALYIDGMDADAETVAHELAHHVSFHLFPRQRRWFAEGLASFVQTVASHGADADGPAGFTRPLRTGSRRRLGPEPGGVPAGLATQRMRRWLDVVPAVDAGELLRWRSGLEHDGRHHAWSWLLYHWTWNRRPRPFADFTHRLSDGEDPDAAWLAAFPDFDPARPDDMKRLSDELENYRHRGAYGYYRVHAECNGASQEVPLSRGDLHVAILETRAVAADAAQQRAALEEALREDPGHAVATAWLARLSGTSPVAALRERTRAAPSDGWAWLELGRALQGTADEAERTAALRKATELLPDVARAHRALAGALLAAEKAREALAPANRALDLAPWDPLAVVTLGGVAARLGQCSQARQLASRALDSASPEGAEEQLRALMADVERRCAAAAPAKERSPSR